MHITRALAVLFAAGLAGCMSSSPTDADETRSLLCGAYDDPDQFCGDPCVEAVNATDCGDELDRIASPSFRACLDVCETILVCEGRGFRVECDCYADCAAEQPDDVQQRVLDYVDCIIPTACR